MEAKSAKDRRSLNENIINIDKEIQLIMNTVSELGDDHFEL